MEANFGGERCHFYGEASDLGRIRKKGFEWDLNDWKWNGELFIATPVNSVPSECRNKQLFPVEVNGFPSNSSSSCSEETDFGIVGKGKGEAEKRRRIVTVEEDEPYDGAASLSLKLAEHVLPVVEGALLNGEERNGKKSKLQGGTSNRPICQVKDCGVDLSSSKDYHRRHKVCEMHAKASTAVVGNAVQRFCQQCSRFHLLEEFDEGKRSCRRRLAGHNRRRRKTHPGTTAGGPDLIDDRTSSYLLINLLRILCNLHSDNSEHTKDQDLLSHLLSNLANNSGSFDARNISALLQTSQTLQKLGSTAGTLSEAANNLVTNSSLVQESSRLLCSTSKVSSANDVQTTVPTENMHSKTNIMTATPEPTAYRARLKDFDLNNTYSDTEDCGEGCEESATLAYTGTDSRNCPSWMLQDTRQSSPPQTSGNSDSASGQSLSSSNGDIQCRTDRIVFKLFGKDPHDLPLVLRAQILDWLSNSPTEIESYMRPGCIILTIYLRLAESSWKELCSDLSSYLDRLLCSSTDEFWKSGWIYARVQHQIGFIYNGQTVLDTHLPLIFPDHSKIVCIKPIAVPPAATVNFTVKGFNIAQPATRLLCSFEGNYLVQESTRALVKVTYMGTEKEGPECLSFSCSLPDVRGRGFIEVEDNGLSNGFFPFIVAEQDVCSEICMLENAIDIATHDDDSHGRADAENVRNQALQFLNELGWLLRRDSLRFKKTDPYLEAFQLKRFQWLIVFAMERDWCAVIKKLLDILFGGAVDLNGKSPREIALSENLLHTAVRRNCKAMVELLLKYTPHNSSKETSTERLLFRPDILGPSNITPLHIAASSSGAESVLDALINDPEMVGIEAWKNARDTTGFTPEDYACAQGHKSYLLLVQKEIDRQLEKQVVISIPGEVYQKNADGAIPNSMSLEISKNKLRPTAKPSCNLCSRQLAHQSFGARTLLYRPAMLSMVGIAAVCVCVGLFFKTPPEVFFVFPSFRWEHLRYGSM
ncbi:squamosa promoter-binding-like protein 6 [Typha latifolia]|uniref:squamosa promoter-binding-like protein 6 n=1 Tax=Typha latifolia TaxID=4733 RepID=UPI003C2EE187